MARFDKLILQVKSVFLDGLSANWDEEYVKEQLKKYGEIEKVELARDMPTAKRKDFAFVCFTTRDAALSCIEGVNKDGICNDGEKVGRLLVDCDAFSLPLFSSHFWLLPGNGEGFTPETFAEP